MSFEPKILGFLCQNGPLLSLDYAGIEMRQYPANFYPIKLPCLGALDILYPLWAFFYGADGVFISGCSMGYCQHGVGNIRGERLVRVIKQFFKIIGFEAERICFEKILPQESDLLVGKIKYFNNNLIQLGHSQFLKTKGSLERCTQCYRCMEACPICHCKRCFVKTFPNFVMGWLLHVFERCEQCRACKDCCPQGIDLYEIIQALRKDVSCIENPLPNILNLKTD
jgi:F420-non-reducing hydrogenase iron-sulfur subunit